MMFAYKIKLKLSILSYHDRERLILGSVSRIPSRVEYIFLANLKCSLRDDSDISPF